MKTKTQIIDIAQKIVLPMIVAGIFLLTLVVFAGLGLNTIGSLTFTVIDRNAERTVLALGALDNINLATIKEKNTLLEKGDDMVAKNMGDYAELMDSAFQKFDRLKSLSDPRDLNILLPVIDRSAQYRKLTEESVFPLVKQGNIAKAAEVSFDKNPGGGRALRQGIRADLESMVENDRKEMRVFGQEVKQTSLRTKNIMILIAACGLAIALVWISLIHILDARKGSMNALKELAAGDIEINGNKHKEDITAVIRALELFKENAGKARRQAEDEEKEYARKLEDLKKDLN